jgi:15-cis-phytoene synthase
VKRPHVHALYAFCRYADDIVDDLGPAPTDVRAKALADFGDRFFTDLEAGRSDDPVLKGVVHTVRAFAIPADCFERFLRSMTMDLTVSEYETYADLAGYMDGSAAVIGEMMLPILEPDDAAAARPHARALGDAFQLTNFLRDVGEDLDRGRIYLPRDELAAFGVDRDLLAWCRSTRRGDGRVRRALAYLVAHTRGTYRRAEPGIALLEPVSRACVGCAFRLYRSILDEIEAAGYDVLHRRVAVSNRRRVAVAVPGLARALAARVRC